MDLQRRFIGKRKREIDEKIKFFLNRAEYQIQTKTVGGRQMCACNISMVS